MNEYFEILGNSYYLDIDELASFIRLDEEGDGDLPLALPDEEPTEETIEYGGPMVDMTKWEMVKTMIELVLGEQTSQYDEKMGMQGLANEVSLAFKLAFNTLLKYNIIKDAD